MDAVLGPPHINLDPVCPERDSVLDRRRCVSDGDASVGERESGAPVADDRDVQLDVCLCRGGRDDPQPLLELCHPRRSLIRETETVEHEQEQPNDDDRYDCRRPTKPFFP